MPVVTVQIAKGRTVEQKRRMVEALTHALVSTIDVEPDWVTVLIIELDRENWSTGGILHSDKYGPGCAHQGVDKHPTSLRRRRPTPGRG